MGVEEPGDGAALHAALRDPSFGYRRVGGIPGDVVHQIGYILGGGFAFGELPPVDIVAELVFISKFFEEQIHLAPLLGRAVGLEIGVNVIEKRIPEGDPEEIEMEIVVLPELAPVVEIPLRDQHMNVRMPLHISSKCVQEVNMTKPSLLLSVRDGRTAPEQRIKGFVHRFEQGVQQRLPVQAEIIPQLERDGEDELPVGDLQALLAYLDCPLVLVFLPARGAHPGMAGEPHHVEFVAVRAFEIQVSIFEVMTSYELVYRLDQARPLQPARVLFLEFGPIPYEDVLYADVALKLPRVVAVVLLSYFIIKNFLAVLLGFVDVLLEFREVAVDAQVGVSVVHGDIIKNSDCNSEFHAKFISLLFLGCLLYL